MFCKSCRSILSFVIAFIIGLGTVWTADYLVSLFPLPSAENVFVEVDYEEDFIDRNIIRDWRDNGDSIYESKLLETGEGFHGNEINAKSGEIWLGLFTDGKDHYLAKTRINVEADFDVIVDEPGEMTGKKVSVKHKTEPFFLLNDADYLKDGPVTTLDITDRYNYDEANYMDKGFDKNYTLNGVSYRLRILRNEDRRTLVLESEGIKQIIYTMNTTGDESWTLLWVGDLDGDGKLDFYADMPTYYNFGQKRLFLSSRAEEGKFVKQVALFHTTGC